MSASDGYIGSTLKLVDHGPDGPRWNLVIVGDGYRAGELAQYHTDVQTFIDRIYNTPPFDELWCGINVHRIDVVSTESGADDPTLCGGGTGATPNTYFDSTFCSLWGSTRLDRLLTINSALAQSVALARVPDVDQVLCIVNSSKYGGSGGDVATCSTHAQSAEIAIHEIGHSAFGLADEYEDGGTASGTEPGEPNVTFDPNRATNKWRDLVAATTPMPSSCYGDCAAGCTPPATPAPAGAVGAYEGAFYVHCGAYRPLPSCYMRDYSPFCPVCTRVIRQVLAPFLPAESVTLLTPSISFTDIPEGIGGTGVTAHRAIVFEVATCRRLHFTITAGPTGGFGTPFGTTAEARPAQYAPTGSARLWLSYTSTSAGASASGTVTVRLNETGQTWNININANTVPRPKSAVSLVLDHSGSMAEGAGDGLTKVQKLREAARIFVDAMLPGDGIGLVRFDDTAQRVLDVVDVGPLLSGAGRTDAINFINGPQFDPAGATSIGAGVLQGRDQLNAATAAPNYTVRAMLVLSDGVENTSPMLSSVTSSINANTFAIGLGLPYNISVAALNTLTQGTGGSLLITGALTTDQRTRLTKYFLQVLAGITNANVITDPAGVLSTGAEHRIPFQVSEADYGLDAFVLSPYPEAIEYQLETPDGNRIDPASAAALGTTDVVVRNGAAFYRVALPAIPANAKGSHGGTWHAVLQLGRRYGYSFTHVSAAAGRNLLVPYDFLAHAYSNLVFRASCVQAGFVPGAEVNVFATLKEYDVPVAGSRVSIWAEVRRPDGSTFNLGMAGTEDDPYSGTFHTSIPGVYVVRVRAWGETIYGSPFSREQTCTAVAVPGGGHTPVEPPRDPIAELLCCLFKGGQIPDRLRKRLEELGFESDHVVRCLRRLCARNAGAERERRGPERSEMARARLTALDPQTSAILRALLEDLGGEE
jgi:IgA Peptidase M64/von Willebrand factor type A domain